MYGTVVFICIGLVELPDTQRKPELQNIKFLPTAGLEPTTSRLLDWRYNQLRHGTDVMADIYRNTISLLISIYLAPRCAVK